MKIKYLTQNKGNMSEVNQSLTITMSPQINELMSALSKAQGKIQAAAKDKANPFFKSKYADLASVWDACRYPLSENGLAVIQIPQNKPEGLFLVSILGHSSGQWIQGEVEIPIAKKDPQSIGSAITYFRRYVLSSLVGVAPDDDDDGEKAQAAYRNRTHQTEAPQKIIKPSMKQVNELEAILDSCEEKYRKWVYDYIQKQYQTTNIADLPLEICIRMKEAAVKNMQSPQQKQEEPIIAEVS
jgi:hypothetical protein